MRWRKVVQYIFKIHRYIACALLFSATIAMAEDGHDKNEPKMVTGMSIVGNDETPKSLYIVPWKNSEAGSEVNFTPGVLNEELRPVDKNDFIR
jgi:hypothetical protein